MSQPARPTLEEMEEWRTQLVPRLEDIEMIHRIGLGLGAGVEGEAADAITRLIAEVKRLKKGQG